MAQACIDQKKLRSNQCKFCSNPCIEETSCISCNPTDDQKWTIGVVKHIQLIGNNVKNSKNDDGNKKENRKKISTKTKKSKLSKSTESYYHNGCFYDDINVIVDEIEVQSRKIEQTKEHQEESHKKLSENIDVIVFEKELNENKEIEGNGGVRWMTDRSSSHDNSDESKSDDNDDDEGNHNGEIRVVGQSTTSKRKFKNPFYQRKKKKIDTTIVLDSSSDDGQTIVLDSLSDDSNVNSRPNLHPLRNEEDFQNGIDQASTPISENPPQFITIGK